MVQHIEIKSKSVRTKHYGSGHEGIQWLSLRISQLTRLVSNSDSPTGSQSVRARLVRDETGRSQRASYRLDRMAYCDGEMRPRRPRLHFRSFVAAGVTPVDDLTPACSGAG